MVAEILPFSSSLYMYERTANTARTRKRSCAVHGMVFEECFACQTDFDVCGCSDHSTSRDCTANEVANGVACLLPLLLITKSMMMLHWTSGRRGLTKDSPAWQGPCAECKCSPIRGSLSKCETCNKQFCESCGESHDPGHSVVVEFVPSPPAPIPQTKPKPAE